MIEVNQGEQSSETLTRLMRQLADARRGLHATEQALSDMTIAGQNAFVVASAAREFCDQYKKPAAESDRIRALDTLFAACDAMTPSPNRMHTVVAVAELEALRAALRLIAGEKCENYIGEWRCWDDGMGRTRGARYTAEAWCDACVAQDALNGGAS